MGKKKKTDGAGSEAAGGPPALPGAGTPDGEKLRDADAAFQAGDYGRVRALARELARAEDPGVADAAAELARRVAVDPVQIAFLSACLIALAIITWIYVLR